ncbi:pyridoxal phosphate-dependent aminotransferase family protein [Kaistella flava (ex Peng et al. 2021)]|uniref:Pyridoxal phosphate-dependent aminotransferase family protein n=1 Tax=Kaistella flava (ex Peng et al. 2021) TaxID=2038776 RepID=A0A7M2Y5S8_9FLAO|nr:pyridoxal phosphate-dependent aminotransferase family protein [Kaistella flava (ex Peng et al. 2021)]QOW09597.1 pyridoxal phosphate-dependent aminotransferase family protein [Kaistella flava (ex Peng et al. 2021)]
MLNTLSKLKDSLEKRNKENVLRSLNPEKQGIDFYSNDYLGLAQNATFQEILLKEINQQPHLLKGATGSRLISGNSNFTMEVEAYIANKHKVESALLLPSGFVANVALFSAIPQRGDIVLMDEFIHRSVRDGLRLSNAKRSKFAHNDLDHLEKLLKEAKGNCFIAVESLYSMEGDFAPLEKLTELAERYNAFLIVDEAHAFGVFGYGLVAQKNLHKKVFATVVTYGKGMGMHGAAILGNQTMISYLVNFSSPVIYTTGSNDFHAMSIKKGYQFLENNSNLSQKLQENISEFRKINLPTLSDVQSPIQILPMRNISSAKKLQQHLENKGFLTFAAVAPTVKEGEERLRICLHSFNSKEEINQLTTIIKEFI